MEIDNEWLDNFAGWCIPEPKTESTGMWLKSYAFLLASYLTDPVCKVREYSWQMELVESSKTKSYLQFGMVMAGIGALGATIPGMVIRGTISYFQNEPFIHLQGNLPEKTLQGSELTLYSKNVAFIAGGYAITHTGVAPWTYRIDGQIKEIREQNSDVVCLFEVFDTSSAFYLYEQMKDEYAHFYFNMGSKAVGPNAGIFVASKYPIQNAEFVPFPVETLQNKVKWTCKGFFRCDIGDMARLYTTHLQNSAEPISPNRTVVEITQEMVEKALQEDCHDDVIARAAQMHLIMEDLKKNSFSKGAVIITGDLNMDEEELSKLPWKDQWDQGVVNYGDKKSWGGDQFSVELLKSGSPASGPANLDHVLVEKNSAAHLETWLVDSGFDGTQFKWDALSDHHGLKSIIQLKAVASQEASADNGLGGVQVELEQVGLELNVPLAAAADVPPQG